MLIYRYELNIEKSSYRPYIFESAEEIRVGDTFILDYINHIITQVDYGNPVRLTAKSIIGKPKQIEIPLN